MPKRNDIKTILVIGSGPIVIGPEPITKIVFSNWFWTNYNRSSCRI